MQTSILNEWADPFPVREFLDLHMMVTRSASLPLHLATLVFSVLHVFPNTCVSSVACLIGSK